MKAISLPVQNHAGRLAFFQPLLASNVCFPVDETNSQILTRRYSPQ